MSDRRIGRERTYAPKLSQTPSSWKMTSRLKPRRNFAKTVDSRSRKEEQKVQAKSSSDGDSIQQSEIVQRQGLLIPEQETAAIKYNSEHYDERSISIIIAAIKLGGQLSSSSAEAVAALQKIKGLNIDGKLNEITLKEMVTDLAYVKSHQEAIQLVVDFYNLNRSSDTLTIHFDSSLATLFSTNFESGNLRVIRLGESAFTGAKELRDAILDGLSSPAPEPGEISDPPTHLTDDQEAQAIQFNITQFTDRRSVLAIQGLVGATPDAIFSGNTVERIAEFQKNNSLTVNGQVEEQTLRKIFSELDASNQRNAAIRLIIDFYNMSEHGALLDVRYDANLDQGDKNDVINTASTRGYVPGPSRIVIGPYVFAQGFEEVVHTIAHELEHVQQLKDGIPSSVFVQEFLAEEIEILSVGMPTENFADDRIVPGFWAGFIGDAYHAFISWNRMTVDEQKQYWENFEAVRNKVRERFNAASPAEQAKYRRILDDYNAVVKPQR